MNGFVLSTDMLLLLLPLGLVQLGLVIYCARLISHEGVQNLSKGSWLAICLFANLLGPIIFLLVGRKQENR